MAAALIENRKNIYRQIVHFLRSPSKIQKAAIYQKTKVTKKYIRSLSNGLTYFRAACRPGIITVEASIVLSIFIAACGIFLSMFSLIRLQMKLQRSMDHICEQAAVWAYGAVWCQEEFGWNPEEILSEWGKKLGFDGNNSHLQEIAELAGESACTWLWQGAVKQMIIQETGREYLNQSRLRGGAEGLSLSRSTWDDGVLDLVLTYTAEPLEFLPVKLSYPVVQRACRHLWIGTHPLKEEADDAIYVYVTGRGTVYHTTRACPHLNIGVEAIDAASLSVRRNKSGCIYYPCEYCMAKGTTPSGTVYITPDGNRCHADRNCGGLNRDIQTLTLEEAKEKYRVCRTCGGAAE